MDKSLGVGPLCGRVDPDLERMLWPHLQGAAPAGKLEYLFGAFPAAWAQGDRLSTADARLSPGHSL